MDIITILALIVGLILLLLGIMKAVKASQAVAVIGLIVFVVGVLGATSMINFSGLVQPTGTFTAGQFQAQPVSTPSSCSANAITSNGKSQADVLIRNVENASLGYLSGTVAANANGAFIDSVTTNAGSSASYASMSNVPNCGAGELVALVTTGIGLASSRRVKDVETNQLVSGYNFNDKAVHKYELLSASSDVISVLARDTAFAESSSGLANGSVGDEWATQTSPSVSGTGTADGNVYFKNTTLGAKGSINFYLDFAVNGTSSVTGQFDEPDGIIISYDTGTASRFSVNSLSLQIDQPSGYALTKVSNSAGGCGVDDIVTNRNVEACWTAPTPKAGVLYRIRGTLTADLGDVLLSDTMPKIYIDDRVSFRDTDGNVKYKSFSTSGTNQGVGGTILNFVLN